MASMDPKPTLYRGVQYRSRLEARWAVYLDHHKEISSVKYEPATFDGYTPDFSFTIKAFRAYLEVKPSMPAADYFVNLRRIANDHEIYLIMAVGSFYNEVPLIGQINNSRYVRLTETILFSEYATHSAAGYRFDLEVPEVKRKGKKYGFNPIKKRKRRRPF